MSSTLQSIKMPLMRERCICSLPLDRAGRLRRIIVDDAVDALDFVDDAGRDPAQELSVERVDIRGHAVDAGHSAETADEVVGSKIAHYADGAHRQEHGERLPDRVVQASVAD